MRFLILFALAGPAFGQVTGPPALPPVDQGGERPSQATLYDGCVRAVPTEPKLAEDFARAWAAENAGGVPARQCLGMALAAQGRNSDAARAFAEAARLGERAKSPFVADLWGQAGNAALLAGDAAGAVQHFTSAIAAAGEFAPRLSAGLHVDRARAAVEAGDRALARRDLDRAMSLDPNDVTAFLLSAALARREGELARAQADVAAASTRAPSDPDVMLEQGNIAAAAGDVAAARAVWEMVVKAAPGSEAARVAADRLKGE
jgi:tetratricopeptide (TPR) repeat protein